MSERIVARVEADPEDDEAFIVRSPAVGVADSAPDVGVFLNPREGFLSLGILGRRHIVQLPRNVQGRVVERFIDDTETPLAYNQQLFRLSQAHDEEATVAGAKAGAAGGIDADLIPVESPSEGVFYRRPSPESPPYIEEGGRVTKGAVVGLVEVMKCFNQIRYGGPGFPDEGKVKKVLVDDAAEVTFGQVLFLVEPA